MKHHLIRSSWVLALGLTAGVTGLAKADGLALGFFAEYEACDLQDSVGLHTLYVFQTFSSGATGSRFRVQAAPGMTMTYVSEASPYQTVGNSQDGISVCYNGHCLVGSFPILTMTYMGYGTSSPNCTRLLLVPFPGSETVETLDCAFSSVATYVRDLRVNQGSPCGCADYHLFDGIAQEFSCAPLPVATSTWGAIKALYQE